MELKSNSAYKDEELSNEDFADLQQFLRELTGIAFDKSKFQLINTRLWAHKQKLSFVKWCDYVAYLKSHRQLVSQDIINLITTNKTEFFREKIQFSILQDIIAREKYENLLLWSAACSKGHEVYSLDICLDKLRSSTSLKKWNILGTDINSAVLQIAENAIYPLHDFDSVEESLIKEYFLKGSDDNEGFYKYRTKNLDHIKFRHHHLLHGDRLDLNFDFILLRNVLIYFEELDRLHIVKKLLHSLKGGGYLFLGLSEAIELSEELEYLGNSIYRKKKSNGPASTRKGKKKILVIDDSSIIPKIVEKMLSEEGESYELVGHAKNTIEARKMIFEYVPDLITLDIQMPGENEDEFYRQFLKYKSIPTIVLSSLDKDEGDVVLKMLEEGVSDYIQKPKNAEFSLFKNEFLAKIAISLESKQQRVSLLRRESIEISEKIARNSLIAIGASTGGTMALAQLLPTFPEVFPPTVVIQHIPRDFSFAFAERLNTLCTFKVKEAENGELLEHSTVYIAPGNKQLRIIQEKGVSYIEINNDPPLNRHSPSVDYFFNSIKNLSFQKVVAVILTGMGRDGAKEMLELKKLGHKTIGQSEESCVVYGMPKAAKDLEAVDIEVSLSQMGREIFKTFR